MVTPRSGKNPALAIKIPRMMASTNHEAPYETASFLPSDEAALFLLPPGGGGALRRAEGGGELRIIPKSLPI